MFIIIEQIKNEDDIRIIEIHDDFNTAMEECALANGYDEYVEKFSEEDRYNVVEAKHLWFEGDRVTFNIPDDNAFVVGVAKYK